ncbi:MAG: hypothetical protein R6U96_09370 [Promethearchaeia archaeon]
MYLTIEELSGLRILNSLFSLIFVLVSIMIALRILSKYVTTKHRDLIPVGLAWVLLSTPWWSPAFNLVTVYFFNYSIDPPIYLFIMTAFIPYALICWIYAFSKLTYPESKKKIFYPFLIICLAYSAVFMILFLIKMDFIAKYEGGFTYHRTFFNIGFLLFTVISAIVSGILFTRRSLQSPNPEIRWKGRFLLIAFFSFVGGATMDIFSRGNIILQLSARILLIISAICYYLGFFLPPKLKQLLV